MKRAISIIITAIMILSVCTTAVSAVPKPFIDDDGSIHQYEGAGNPHLKGLGDRAILFDCTNGSDITFTSAYILCWNSNLTDQSGAERYEMEFFDFNEYGEAIYSFDLPEDMDMFCVTDGERTTGAKRFTEAMEYYPDIVYYDYPPVNGSLELVELLYMGGGENDPELKYYMLNQYVGWERLEEGYRFKRTDRTDKEEYLLSNVSFKEGDSFRAYGTQDDLDKADNTEGAVYPDGMGWYYGIPEDGIYDVYFYPNVDGEYPGDIDNYWNNGYWSGYFVVVGPKAEGELYREIFKKHFNFVEFNGYNSSLQTIGKYEELYYHKDKDDRIDWALIEVRARQQKPTVVFSVIGNRVFDYDDWQCPFASGYCVYDVVNDKFSDASDADNEKFPGFSRAVDEAVKKSPYNNRGRLIGDMDGDDELTMIDATLIQRCDIRIRDWPEDDLIKPEGHTYKKPPTYYSDFDRNGERDIVDATKLQRYVTMID